MYFNDVNIALGLMFAAFSGAGSAPLGTPLKFSTPEFSTLATWCHVFHSTFSTPAFSTLSTWCRVFHSRIFHSRVFSAPNHC